MTSPALPPSACYVDSSPSTETHVLVMGGQSKKEALSGVSVLKVSSPRQQHHITCQLVRNANFRSHRRTDGESLGQGLAVSGFLTFWVILIPTC